MLAVDRRSVRCLRVRLIGGKNPPNRDTLFTETHGLASVCSLARLATLTTAILLAIAVPLAPSVGAVWMQLLARSALPTHDVTDVLAANAKVLLLREGCRAALDRLRKCSPASAKD